MDNTNTNLELRQSKSTLVIGILCGTLFLVITCISVFSTILNNDYTGAWFCGIVFGGFTILGASLINAYFRIELYISTEKCINYNFFSQKKEFMWSDIAYAKQSIIRYGYNLKLMDKHDKTIIKVESGTANSDKLLQLLKEQNVEITSYLAFVSEKAAFIWNEPVDETNWQSLHINQIRTANRCLIIMSILAILSARILPPKVYLSMLTLSALLPYILMIIFPKAIMPSINRQAPQSYKDTHIEFSYLAFLLPFLIMIFATSAINVFSWGRAIIFGIILFILISSLYFIFTPKKLITVGNAFCVMFFMGMFCFPATYTINYALQFKPAIHENVTVIDSRISNGKYFNDYYVKVQKPSGEGEEISTSRSTYKQASAGLQKRLCLRKSIFGIELVTLHE